MSVNRPIGPYFAQSRQARPALPPDVANKPVLFSTDVDGTYLSWEERQGDFNAAAIRSNGQALQKERADLAVHINTGRGLATMKEVGPLLKAMPLDLMSVNNGQELFVNWGGERADRWLAGLEPDDVDPFWAQFLKTAHRWDGEQVRTVMREQFTRAGYVPMTRSPVPEGSYPGARPMIRTLPTGERMLLKYFPDQPAFTLAQLMDQRPDGTPGPALAYTPAAQAEAKKLRATLQGTLAGQGVQTRHFEGVSGYGGNRFVVMSLSPQGVSKATVIEGLRRFYMPALKGVITAGDSPYNDVAMLRARSYGEGARQVPNHPILSGDDPEMRRALANHPRMVEVKEGWLAPGIARQTGRILDRQA